MKLKFFDIDMKEISYMDIGDVDKIESDGDGGIIIINIDGLMFNTTEITFA